MFACGAGREKKKMESGEVGKQAQDHKEQDQVSMTDEKSCRR